ncbi:MAG: SMP-30/gluconolactonase/LRE family protein [Pseudomonadota bacterium]
MNPQPQVIAAGLRFPEGPVALADGSVLLVEIERQTLSRVAPDGTVTVVAETGGGPNGAALGPDGRCYLCNNGGFVWHESGERLVPGLSGAEYSGGRLQVVDLADGAVTTLYTDSDRGPLNGPNDIVFDAEGGFWFSDLGKIRERDMDRGYIGYARTDGSECRQVIRGLVTPNGVGLSPDGKTLYAAETLTGRLWSWPVVAPGKVAFDRASAAPSRGSLMFTPAAFQEFDSLAVDGAGNVCVATLHNGGITVVAPDGGSARHLPMPDPATTNICFGGPDLATAYITLSSTGQLVSVPWPEGGLALHWRG